jgi:aminomethyltransferase
MLQRTPLFSRHQQLQARLVDFGGWEMPIQYTSILDEHATVRNRAGVFDISHMGEIEVTGPHALAFLNHLLTNDVAKLAVGQAQYSLLCQDDGGVLDDLYVYRVGSESYVLVINASRIADDAAWIGTRFTAAGLPAGTVWRDRSNELGAIAVQGPQVRAFIDLCFPPTALRGATPEGTNRVSALKKNELVQIQIPERPELSMIIACTGYTGEDGFELIAPAHMIGEQWDHVFRVGAASGLKPIGLGARDTLRTEMGYPLYGHELDRTTTPIEAGLGFFVAFEKGEFIGRARLAEQKRDGVRKRCVAFRMVGPSAPPRAGYAIWNAESDGALLGQVASGTLSPSLGCGIGLGFVPPSSAKPGTPLFVEIRGKRARAEVVTKPIYKKPV